jgi:hypothetical protein
MTALNADYTQLVSLKVTDIQVTGNTLDSAGTALSATNTETNKLAGVTAGTTTASKALVVDANKALDALNVVSLSTGAGAGTAITATSAELNKNAGVTAGTAAASKTAVLGATKNLDTLLLAVATDQLLRLSPKPTDTFAGTMTIDVTYTHHVVVGASGTSATVTMTPSAAGTAGDLLVIQFQTTAAGQVVATYASTFHSSGTQTNAASRFSTIAFVSDGTQWNELFRTTALT